MDRIQSACEPDPAPVIRRWTDTATANARNDSPVPEEVGSSDTDTVILNGFGRCLGDGVIGLQALSVAIQAGAIAPNPVLLRLPGLPAITRELYHAAADLAAVRTLPWADQQRGAKPDAAAAFSTLIDLRDLAFDPAFRQVAMIDSFSAAPGPRSGRGAAGPEAQYLALRLAFVPPRHLAGRGTCWSVRPRR